MSVCLSVCQHGGRRAKLRTVDNNDIDTMFVDRRRHDNRNLDNNANTLVCSRLLLEYSHTDIRAF